MTHPVFPQVVVQPSLPPRKFKHLIYYGKLMERKMKSRSQFYPYIEDISFNPHSQIGDSYSLAQLGSLDELYDRLAKYDKEDLPLNRALARRAIKEFTDKVGNCGVVPYQESIDHMDKSKSIGFGAQKWGIFSRGDPKMSQYYSDWFEAMQRDTHFIIVSASQKDEVRVVGKTARLFMSFPPEHTLAATHVLGDFMRKFVEHRVGTDGSISSVGDAPQCGALYWYKEMLNEHPYLYCTDTSAQDSSVTREFMEMVYDEIELLYDYNDEERNIFNTVRHNSINKLVNMNGHLYLVPRGLGSGDFLTIVINIMWRYYMILENYQHNIDDVLRDNRIIICGDDLIMSSEFSDLNLDSKYAGIEWKRKPISWAEADFCSLKFEPYIHHDPIKVMSVVKLRRKLSQVHSNKAEMNRLGGLLRVLSNKNIYDHILDMMIKLVDEEPELENDFRNMYVEYDFLFSTYNCPFIYN